MGEVKWSPVCVMSLEAALYNYSWQLGVGIRRVGRGVDRVGLKRELRGTEREEECCPRWLLPFIFFCKQTFFDTFGSNAKAQVLCMLSIS